MFTIAICSNSEDVYYEFKKTIVFDDLDDAVVWVKKFLQKDKSEYRPYCFEIDQEKWDWFAGLDEDNYEDFYLTLTMADDTGYAGGYMSENAILYAILYYSENVLGKINFCDKWDIYPCENEEVEEKYHIFRYLQECDIPVRFYDN